MEWNETDVLVDDGVLADELLVAEDAGCRNAMEVQIEVDKSATLGYPRGGRECCVHHAPDGDPDRSRHPEDQTQLVQGVPAGDG